jgi:aminopeptidase N
MRWKVLLLTLLGFPACMLAQEPRTFSHADTLRGMLTPERTCYDVRYYHLDVRVDPDRKWISGSNLIRFTVVQPFTRMQIDLFSNMIIRDIALDGRESLPFERDGHAVFVSMPAELPAGTGHSMTITYEGEPVTAVRPPWDGGFIWTTDELGNPWVAVACQGTGASLWWPNKDHQSDEPDSMLISITVPPGLQDVSNGRFRGVSKASDGWERYDWFVSYPINNYNVTVNIGSFDHFSDVYSRADGPLSLDYYVMPYNREKAEEQFLQVKPMLGCFEQYFGPYPFAADGFKLVETPYLGMEHQGAVAYGNQYMNGYAGTVQSAVGPASEIGLGFDFIIIHESAHEWWGNSVTAADIADMWIHESFAAYAEALYVECRWGREAALDYVNAKTRSIRNDKPMVGTHNVHQSGSGDMYNKGQAVLNTLRSVINNDSLWFSMLRGIAATFAMRTISGEDIVAYVNRVTGDDYSGFFNQYFRHTRIPVLEAYAVRQGKSTTLRYRWIADVPGFSMPVKVTTGEGGFGFIHPTTSWQTTSLGDMDPREFRVASDEFYVDTRLSWAYLDPRKSDSSFIRR